MYIKYAILLALLLSYSNSLPTHNSDFLSDTLQTASQMYQNESPSNSNLHSKPSSENAFLSSVRLKLNHKQSKISSFQDSETQDDSSIASFSGVEIDGTQLNLHGISFQSFKSISEFIPELIFVTPSEITADQELDIFSYWPTPQDLIQTATLNATSIEIVSQDKGTNKLIHIKTAIGQLDSGSYELKLYSRFGQSHSRWSAFSHDLNEQKISVEVLPVVYKVYPSLGSPEGGQTLTIEGSGFNSKADSASVEILGVPCEIQSLEPNQIICKTSKKDAGNHKYYQGNAGWRREIWYNSSQNLRSAPDVEDIIPSPDFYISSSDYTVRLSSIFTPKKDEFYRFYLASNGTCSLSISDINSLDTYQYLINTQEPQEYRSFFQGNSTSEYVSMSLNSSYYLEVIGIGRQPGYITLGLEVNDGLEHLNTPPNVSHLVIKPQNVVREVQKLIIRGVEGGNLILRSNSYVSSVIYPRSDIDWNYWNCEDILKAIQEWGYGSMHCDMLKQQQSVTYTFSFLTPVASNRYLISADISQILSSTELSTHSYIQKYPTDPLIGSFKITNQSTSTPTIPIGTPLQELQNTIINSFSSLGNSLLVMGSSNLDGLDIYILSDTTHQFELQVDIKHSTAIQYGVDKLDDLQKGEFWWAVPSKFVRTFEDEPQVRVNIDGNQAVCKGICSYGWVDIDSLPRINDMLEHENILTILGGPFTHSQESYIPMIGNDLCPILNYTSTSILCTRPNKISGSYPLNLYINSTGLVPTHPQFNKTVDYNSNITAIWPDSGSIYGGTVLTILGTGFYPSMDLTGYNQSVYIGSSECEILSSNLTSISCITSARNDSDLLSLNINGKQFTDDSFRYDMSITPNISSIYPSTLAAFETNRLSISGDFITQDFKNITVTIGNTKCDVETLEENELKCKFYGAPRGKYDVKVKIEGVGLGILKDSFEVLFEVTSVSVDKGSLAGGTLVEVDGIGLYSQRENIKVYLGSEDLPCALINITLGDTLTCLTHPHFSNQTFPISLAGRANNEASYSQSFNFTYSDLFSPIVTNISSTSGTQGDTLTISGYNFPSNSQDLNVTIGIYIPVLTSSNSSITFILPEIPAGVYPISIQSLTKGYSIWSVDNLFTYQLSFISLSSNSTSQNGGDLTLIMHGMTQDCAVHLDEVDCYIRHQDHFTYSILCNPFHSSDSALLLNVQCKDSVFQCEDISKCGVIFKNDSVPIIESIEGDLIIKGSGLSSLRDVEVYIGDTVCEVVKSSDQEIHCLPKANAGNWQVKVLVPHKGWAKGDFWYFQELDVKELQEVRASYSGGMEIELNGKGFYEGVKVNICGSECDVEYLDNTHLKCKSPKVVNNYAQLKYTLLSPDSEITGFSIYNSTSQDSVETLSILTDSNPNTSYFTSTCSLFLLKPNYKLSLSKISLLSSVDHYNDYSYLSNLKIHGSKDKKTWQELGRLDSSSSGWNNLTLSLDSQYLAYSITRPGGCKLSELKLYGHLIYDIKSSNFKCDIDISIRDSNITGVSLKNKYRVDEDSLAVVQSIDPRVLRYEGGEQVTISGYKFGNHTLGRDARVVIDSVYCSVVFMNDSSIECVSGKLDQKKEHSLELAIKDRGYAVILDTDVMYVNLWSDEATWNMKSGPLDGEDVFIPKGRSILLDTSSNSLSSCIIEGVLILQDSPGIFLSCDSIRIRNGGKLQIGSRNKPVMNEVVIKVNRGIMVEDGELIICGKKYNSITQNVVSITENTKLEMSNNVDWDVGGEVVILDRQKGITERAIIQAVDSTSLLLESDLINSYELNSNTVSVYYISSNVKIYSQSSQDLEISSSSSSSNVFISNTEYLYNPSTSYSEVYLIDITKSNIIISNLSIHAIPPKISSFKTLTFTDYLEYTTVGHSSIDIHNLLPDAFDISLGNLKLAIFSGYSYASISIKDVNRLSSFNPSSCIDTDGYWLDLEDTKNIQFSMLNNCPQITQFDFSSINRTYSRDQNLAMFDIPIFDFESSKEILRMIVDISSLDSYINITNRYSSIYSTTQYLNTSDTQYDSLQLQIGKQTIDSRDSVSFRILEEPIVYRNTARRLTDQNRTYIRPVYNMQSYQHSPGSFIIFSIQPHNTTNGMLNSHDLQLNFSLSGIDFNVNYAQNNVYPSEEDQNTIDTGRIEWWIWFLVVICLLLMAILALLLIMCQNYRRKIMFEELNSPAACSPEIVLRGFPILVEDRFSSAPHRYSVSVNFVDEVPFVRSPTKHHTENTEIMRSRSITITEEQSPIPEEPRSPQSASITECQTLTNQSFTSSRCSKRGRTKSMAQLRDNY